MPVVAVVNQKGGCGKSTVATHLAAYLSLDGVPVMLGDMDHQKSTAPWLQRRAVCQPPGVPIVGRTVDPQNVMRPPAGVQHVILDTPGGLHGFKMWRMLMSAHAVLIPVCDSAFDRESAAQCLDELRSHPQISSGRVKLAVIGMRVDGRTRAEQNLRDWAQAHNVEFLSAIRSSQVYMRCIERGLTMFDMRPSKVAAELQQWQPVLRWLQPILEAKPAAATLLERTVPMMSLLRPASSLSPGSTRSVRTTAPSAVKKGGLRSLFSRLLSAHNS